MSAERERYRALEAELRPRRFAFLALAASGIRTGLKKKLPLLLLLGLPAAWCTVFCFNVYLKYTLDSGKQVAIPMAIRRTLLQFAANSIDIAEQIDAFFNISRFFAVLVMAWFGGGALADDRRLGAHVLLFSRPLTRFDYLLGRFLAVAFFGLLATLVPGLVICATAAFNSPDWEFVRKQGFIIWGTILYSVIVVTVVGLLVLAVSSLAARKSFALAGILGSLALPDAVARVLHGILKDHSWRVVSPMTDLRRIAWDLLEVHPFFDWPPRWSYWVLGGLAASCVAVLAIRVRRWETVA